MGHHNQRLASCATFGLLVLAGCGDPCLDDGLNQDPDAEGCPSAADSLSDSATESGQTDTASETESGGGACFNGVQDPGETGIDCGGTCAAGCGTGEGCGGNEDCASGVCGADGTCEGTDCTNGIQDGDETDVDCGGSCPAGCGIGEGCGGNEDCTSMMCSDEGVCTGGEGDCTDGVQNGTETDVDCGGPACGGCDDGEMCIEDGDCTSEDCTDNVCQPVVPMGCRNGEQDGAETDVDCGGDECPACDDGEMCTDGSDCTSLVCTDGTCQPPSCTDNVQNGDETDLDCGGACGATCDPGENCDDAGDCISAGCLPDGTCAALLTVDPAPVCAEYTGTAIDLAANAMGGSGAYTYAWTPAAGLDDATSATPAATPTGFVTYAVTVDDGVNQATGNTTVVNANDFDLQNNCTLYNTNDYLPTAVPASITYSQGGTRACEQGNNDFGLHLCEGVVFEDVRLTGDLEVESGGAADDDMIGLVWGAQDSSHFYSMFWKAGAQTIGGCAVDAGITVKRIEAMDFASITWADLYCNADSPGGTILLSPAETTTAPWQLDVEYSVVIDFQTTGSHIAVTFEDNMMVTQTVAEFDLLDTTFQSGFFGSTTASQINACVGGLSAECL